jgi:hypothetical protein
VRPVLSCVVTLQRRPALHTAQRLVPRVRVEISAAAAHPRAVGQRQDAVDAGISAPDLERGERLAVAEHRSAAE